MVGPPGSRAPSFREVGAVAKVRRNAEQSKARASLVVNLETEAGERNRNEGVWSNTIDSRQDTDTRHKLCSVASAIMTNKGPRWFFP